MGQPRGAGADGGLHRNVAGQIPTGMVDFFSNTQCCDEEADAAFIQKWIDKQISRSEYAFGTTPAVTDQFMTIYTCGDNHDSSDAQSRLYFFLRQVNPVSTKFGGGAAEAAPQA